MKAFKFSSIIFYMLFLNSTLAAQAYTFGASEGVLEIIENDDQFCVVFHGWNTEEFIGADGVAYDACVGAVNQNGTCDEENLPFGKCLERCEDLLHENEEFYDQCYNSCINYYRRVCLRRNCGDRVDTSFPTVTGIATQIIFNIGPAGTNALESKHQTFNYSSSSDNFDEFYESTNPLFDGNGPDSDNCFDKPEFWDEDTESNSWCVTIAMDIQFIDRITGESETASFIETICLTR